MNFRFGRSLSSATLCTTLRNFSKSRVIGYTRSSTHRVFMADEKSKFRRVNVCFSLFSPSITTVTIE